MKLHPALKDPEMKYPRLANALLDVGMVLTILSAAGLTFGTVFYRDIERYMSAGILALTVGCVLLACAGRVSKLRCKVRDERRPTLRRVK